MITIDPVLVVEGKYDKIKLAGLVDTMILTTDGFRIFKDKEKIDLLRTLARSRGILILTDSDHAGFQIRNRLKQYIPHGKLYHAYIPDLYGKEKRKTKASAEGKLGVEGMPVSVLEEILTEAGVTCWPSEEIRRPITKSDFMAWGLAGTDRASANRKQLQKQLDLPENLSANTLLEVLNRLYSYDAIQTLIQNKNAV